MGERVRHSVHVGKWYPRDADALRVLIDGFLDDLASLNLKPSAKPASLSGVLVPHAGLRYSGAVAAFAYRLLQGLDTDLVVMIGPSHRVDFEGVALETHDGFETPLGVLHFDTETAARIASLSSRFVKLDAAHATEHCLEMQYPFLQRVRPDCRVLPMVMGRQTRETVDETVRVLTEVMSLESRKPLLMASSDLSHYLSRRDASASDRLVLDCVEAMDVEALGARFQSDPRCACGGGPLRAVMAAAAQLGPVQNVQNVQNAQNVQNVQGRVLRYADSGDVTGDFSSVVGYASAAFGVWPQ